jgi:Tfp pilus assembly protein PilF/pimeloyl-ACP methyl ester carboxylesterase
MNSLKLLFKLLFIFYVIVLISGCNYLGLLKESYLDDSSKNSCVLMGEIRKKGRTSRPILVVAFLKQYSVKQKAQIIKVADFTMLKRPGPYALYLTEGEYNIAAFMDFNENLIYEADDFAGWHGMPDTVSIKSGQVMGGLDIVVSDKIDKSFDFPISIKGSEFKHKKNASLEHEGVASLDDNIFSKKYSSMGLWSPAEFIRKVGIHIYSLEQYDQSKIPILYIHGAGGSPRNFSYLAKNINRDIYQPWFFYYPSGLKLEKISDILHKKIEVLYNKYDFKVLYLTGHSMGGLIARSLINKYANEKRFDFLRLFISISTPYGGNEVSRFGVDYSPAHISSWEDVAIGSTFLKRLFMRKMPLKTRFYLFFGYAGDKIISMGVGDGKISLKSQLDPKAKAEAALIFGFDEDHVSILKSSRMLEKYNEILSGEHANISKIIKKDKKPVILHGEYQVITKITAPMAEKKKSLAFYDVKTLTAKNKRRYINMLRSIKDVEVIQAAKIIDKFYPHDTELVKEANNTLVKKFKKKTGDSIHVDAISWLCNILGSSEDVRHVPTLKQVKQETDNEKIKKFAARNLAKLMRTKYYPLSRFSKCIHGDCTNGLGTIVLHDMLIYTGNFKRGWLHGYGKMTFPDKSGYKGIWSNDQMHGEGVLTYPDGAVYTGKLSNNMRAGYGDMIFPGGMKFVGEFRHDMRHGPGKKILPNGTTLEGVWRNGRIRGKETVFSPHYAKTETTTRMNKSFPDSDSYIDTFKDRLPARRLNAELRIEKGNTLFSTSNYDYAINYYGKALELLTNNKTAYVNRGTAFAKKSLYIEAIDDFSKAIEIDPENSIAYNNRGFVWEKRGYYKRALEDFNRALKLNPRSIDALCNRGCIWFLKGKPDKAINDFTTVLKFDKKNDIAYYNRGCAWIEKKNFKRAISDMQHALQLKTSDSRYKNVLVLLKEKAGEN